MIAAVIMTFAAVFLTVLAAFFTITAARHSPAAELKRRLRGLSESGAEGKSSEFSGDLIRGISPVEALMFRLPLLRRVQRLVVQSGIRIPVNRLLLLVVFGSFVGFMITYILKNNVIVALLAAMLVVLLTTFYLQYRRRQREQRFTEQLPDALTMIARSLRAGHSFVGAIELLAQELGEPAGELFKTTYEQQKLGMRVTDALALLLDRIESVDLRFFVTIVNINNEVGGNLAEILEKLAETIRSRLQVRRQVQVATAQGRLSGYILAILPVAMFIMIYLMLPGYLDVFFLERRSQYILCGAAVMELFGFLVIRKIVDITI